MTTQHLNININAASFDNEANTEENLVRLDVKTSYALNIIRELMMRGNYPQAVKALDELRYNGRLFNSQKYFL